jgi:hypothetical protein
VSKCCQAKQDEESGGKAGLNANIMSNDMFGIMSI